MKILVAALWIFVGWCLRDLVETVRTWPKKREPKPPGLSASPKLSAWGEPIVEFPCGHLHPSTWHSCPDCFKASTPDELRAQMAAELKIIHTKECDNSAIFGGGHVCRCPVAADADGKPIKRYSDDGTWTPL